MHNEGLLEFACDRRERINATPTSKSRSDSVHVLVYVRLRRYCHLLRHPAKSKWRAGLLLCVCYANPCVDVRLAATFQDLDSKSADPCGRGSSTLPHPRRSELCHLKVRISDSQWMPIRVRQGKTLEMAMPALYYLEIRQNFPSRQINGRTTDVLAKVVVPAESVAC